MNPPAQRRFVDAEFPGDRGDRTPGVDHQLHGFVLVLRGEPPTCASHDEHPLLRGVHATGSRPLLFARARADERAFWFLGPGTYVGHEGEKPMSVTWKLRSPLPGDLFAAFAAAVA